MATEDGFDGIEEQQKKQKQVKICPHCGLEGHVRKTSKFCKQNPKNLSTTQSTHEPAPDAQASIDLPTETLGMDPAEDIDAHDALPFDVDLPGMDLDAKDEFHDCGTWSDDEDGILMVAAPL